MNKLLCCAIIVVLGVIFQVYTSQTPALIEMPDLPENYIFTDPRTSVLNFTIIHTNDMHSAIEGVGLSPKQGQYAKVAHAIKHYRAAAERAGERVLTVDAGDWFGGSLMSKLGCSPETNRAPELEFFDLAGYDAITLGNHEFDEKEEGLQTMLGKWKTKIPILLSNVRTGLEKYLRKDGIVDKLPQVSEPVIAPYLVTPLSRETNICIVGVMSPDGAYACGQNRQHVTFEGVFNDETNVKDFPSFVELVESKVANMKSKHQCGATVAVIHGGYPEDHLLAQKLSGKVDIIIGSHTHQVYLFETQPQGGEQRQTFLQQCGSEGKYIGVMSYGITKAGKVFRRLPSQCVPITEDTPSDPVVQKAVSEWVDELIAIQPSKLFSHSDIIYNKRVRSAGDAGVSGISWDDGHFYHEQLNDFSLYSSTLLTVVHEGVNQLIKAQSLNLPPVDLAIFTEDGVRVEWKPHKTTGNVTVAFHEAYQMFPTWKDSHAAHFWIRKQDLSWIPDCSFLLTHLHSPLMKVGWSQAMQAKENPWGIPLLNKFSNFKINGVPFAEAAPLVHCTTDYFHFKYLFQKIPQDTKGFLAGIVKRQDGSPMEKVEEALLPFSWHDGFATGLKQWHEKK